MAMKCKKNYYDILGVTPDSDNDEVKSSYRKLARKYHPDVNRDFSSEEMFKDVLEAYETLSDEAKRKTYDMVNGFYKTPKYDYSPKYSNQDCNAKDTKKDLKNDTFETFENKEKEKVHKSASDEKENDEKFKHRTEKFDNYSAKFFKNRINSILDDITKNHSEKKMNKELKNGDDIKTEIRISLNEAINGTERVLNIMHKEVCPHCNGRKFINGTKCAECSGQGVYEERRKITVKIPAGIKNNSKLRLSGEGNPGFNGGKNGNLYINIIVENDNKMKIVDNNILYSLPISPFEAVLGAEIDIPSPQGNVKFSLPPMTTTGQQFRISEKGLKTNCNFGDMIITVEIQLPKDLSNDEISLYARLKKLSKCDLRDSY